MRIELARRNDGGTTLRCIRDDGSVTWQNQRGNTALFFAVHDITHYALESELGFRQGFFGLVASGWDIDETGENRGKRGQLPIEAIVVEHLVGLLDRERSSRTTWPASDFNDHIARVTAERGAPPVPPITDEALARVRARIDELSTKWALLDGGQSLALAFPAERGAESGSGA